MSTFDSQTGRLSPQSLLQGHYYIVGQAGRGGMGAVYQAIDTRDSNRRVAIKEMSQGHLSGSELSQANAQFQQEAQMLRRLSHPNLPHIYDAFDERGRSYLVMDFIDGKTLLQVLREADNRPMPVAQVLHYARQLCEVLSYLHQQQPPIIFRDLKPTNVMVTADGHVFLIDFGIARIFKEGQEQDTILLGSPGYAPPEQHGSAQTSPRSDLYSLGATLHYCLTGRDPYHAADRFSFPPVRQYNPQVPIELEQLLVRLLALDEQRRPASALEVLDVLNKISQQADDATRAVAPVLSSASAPTQYVSPSPSPALAATQYAVPGSNAAPPLVLPPTSAMSPAPAQVVQPPSRRSSAPPSASSFAHAWTPFFSILFGLLLLFTLGGSFIAFNIPHPYGVANIAGLDHAVEFALSLVLLVAAIIGCTLVRSLLAVGILILEGLAGLIAGFAFVIQTLQDIHPQGLVLPNIAANSLLSTGLLASGVLSMLWLLRPFTWLDRIILLIVFGIAIACSAFQTPLADAGDPGITKHILLIVVLITLIQGIALAVQMERVRLKMIPLGNPV